MILTDFREFSDRREYDIGFTKIDGMQVNRRVSERRKSDRFRMQLKELFELHMEETVLEDDINGIIVPTVQTEQRERPAK